MPTIKISFKNNRLPVLFRCFLTVLLCLSLALVPSDAFAKSKKTHHKSSKKSTHVSRPYNPPYAHIVVDATTGKVLSQNDADRALYPASLTKIMTLLLTFEALDAGRITLKSPVYMTSHAANMPPSRIGLKPGQSLSVDSAIRALVTKSANDVAVALGEKLGGSETRFAQLMNLKARQIGMSQTHFENASGLHNIRQLSSARDMAKLAIYLMQTYPRYYHYFSLKEFHFNGKVNKNHNKLMSTYRGMDGLKTGYIAPSGFNLVASAKRGNVRLIGVVFGGKSANSRNAQMASLLDSGFEGRPTNYAQEKPLESPKMRTLAVQSPKPPILKMGTSTAPPPAPVPYASALTSAETQSTQSALSNMTSQNTSGVSVMDSWSIQIGAYQDRVSTDQALYRALRTLPAPLNKGNAIVVPLRTSDATWVFRARIEGYTREQAIQACRYLKDCLTISPNSN